MIQSLRISRSSVQTLTQFFFILFFLIHQSRIALASGDACSGNGSFYFSRLNLDECSSDLEFLEPFNDTQTNLSLLLKITNPSTSPTPTPSAAPPITKEEYETRLFSFFKNPGETRPVVPEEDSYLDCTSNRYESAIYFLDQLASAPIQNPGAQELARIRNQILSLCGPSKSAAEIEAKLALLGKNPSLTPFVTYLKGILHFYTDEFESAVQDFDALSQQQSHELTHLALYLKGRALLRLAQKSWDGFSPISDQSFPTLDRSKEAFEKYIQDHPQSRLVPSARGLIRRVAHLKGQTEIYEPLLWKDFDNPSLDPSKHKAIAMEIDQMINYIGNSIPWERPVFAVLGMLKENREGSDRNTIPKNALELLEKNKGRYQGTLGLYEFARVNLLFGLGLYDQAAKLKSPIHSNQTSVLLVSHQIVSAKAHEKLGQFNEATKIWRGLLKGLPKENSNTRLRFQSAIIRSLIQGHQEDQIGKSTSEIRQLELIQPAYRYFIQDQTLASTLAHSQSSKEARKVAEETLLLRSLFSKRYVDFLNVLKTAQTENRKTFGPVETAVHQIVENPHNPKGLMNVGYFLQTLPITPFDFLPPQNRFFSEMKAKYTRTEVESWDAPFQYYLKSLQQFKPSDKDEVEAKTLYFISLCFGPAHSRCFWRSEDRDSTPLEQRKKWFNTLRSKYRDSIWSKKLKYYY